MTPDLEVAIVGAVSAVIVGALALFGVWLQARKTREEAAQQAAATAARVEEVRVLAEPTGNGFADKVTAKLDEVLGTLGRVDERLVLADRRADREAIAREQLADELAAYREQYARDHPIPQQAHPAQEDAP